MPFRPTLRDATPDDGAAAAAIYNPYVRDTVISFETEEVPVEQMGARIAKVQSAGLPWLIAEDADERTMLGFAYAGPFQERDAYRHALELTVYLDPDARGGGIGTLLYGALIERVRDLPDSSRHSPAHGLYSRIALPNDASAALHERFGFSRVGTFTEVGFKHGQWVDVGIWQLLLED
ncbi:GNAT family N-acetyltransferase [Demequina zhanjiangensis]|uniref:N-acetyltransferase family protein n=1 Tax=Demequina zhanjiangensis TaxID=3051659 RepID=A0ABT8G037_9MICO|nr:GNAT family N-acetyltransferase [Demequina sp. SYSU T00b26]MDN4472314.1 N-acetyltransferase family protein [Demequina sp. SYSU T00b26]